MGMIDNIRPVSFSGSTPACFDSPEQYHAWKEMARMAPVKLGPCADCTPDYQRQMIQQKRCENVHVQFVRDSEDGIHGVVIKTNNYLNKLERAT
jgi:hypothetical protein